MYVLFMSNYNDLTQLNKYCDKELISSLLKDNEMATICIIIVTTCIYIDYEYFSPVFTVKKYFQILLKFEVYVLKIFLMIFYINNSS